MKRSLRWPHKGQRPRVTVPAVMCWLCDKPLVVDTVTETNDGEFSIHLRASTVGVTVLGLEGGGFGAGGRVVFDDQRRLVHDQCAAKELATQARWQKELVPEKGPTDHAES